jgi:hypothetical protein
MPISRSLGIESCVSRSPLRIAGPGRVDSGNVGWHIDVANFERVPNGRDVWDHTQTKAWLCMTWLKLKKGG